MQSPRPADVGGERVVFDLSTSSRIFLRSHHADWKLPVRKCGVRSRRRSRPDRSLPLPHLPQDPWIRVFNRHQRPPRPLPLDQGRRPAQGFKSSPGKTRYFCSRCNSHIVAAREGKDTILLRMGCLDTPIADRPKMHIWRSDGASWFDPKDQLPEWPGRHAAEGLTCNLILEPRSGVSKDEWRPRGHMVRDGAARLLTMRV